MLFCWVVVVLFCWVVVLLQFLEGSPTMQIMLQVIPPHPQSVVFWHPGAPQGIIPSHLPMQTSPQQSLP